jgi:uncharacterized membrane protein
VWPLAFANLIRESDETTIWAGLHARQALILGLAGSVGYVAVLIAPLLAVIAVPTLSTEAMVAVYGIGLIVDVIVGIGLLAIGIRYARLAARGELFSIPVVTPLADRWFRQRHP